jgi:hypothetical protein
MIKSDPFLQDISASTVISLGFAFLHTNTVPVRNRLKGLALNSPGPQNMGSAS